MFLQFAMRNASLPRPLPKLLIGGYAKIAAKLVSEMLRNLFEKGSEDFSFKTDYLKGLGCIVVGSSLLGLWRG